MITDLGYVHLALLCQATPKLSAFRRTAVGSMGNQRKIGVLM